MDKGCSILLTNDECSPGRVHSAVHALAHRCIARSLVDGGRPNPLLRLADASAPWMARAQLALHASEQLLPTAAVASRAGAWREDVVTSLVVQLGFAVPSTPRIFSHTGSPWNPPSDVSSSRPSVDAHARAVTPGLRPTTFPCSSSSTSNRFCVVP